MLPQYLMDEHSRVLLEFPKVVEELSALCLSPPGAALLRSQPIHVERSAMEEFQQLALSFRAIMESGQQLPTFDFPDVGGVFSLLGKEGLQLEGEELAAMGRFILSALRLRRYIVNARSVAEARRTGVRGNARNTAMNARSTAAAQGKLTDIASEIPDLSALARRIFHTVDREGTLLERRIPELAAIRERIRRCREEAEASVRGLLDDHSRRTYWQTATPTQRDGRVVLPLKCQYKGRVKGIVHELSASGSTIFIEPLEIVEKNNAIVQEENRYRAEMRRILRELTAEVSIKSSEIRTLLDRTAFLDSIQARARYAVIHSCVRAEPSEPRGGSEGMERRGEPSSAVRLIHARHPHLGAGAVPISIEAGGAHRILIITGPNTGGKTVTLKTVGLLALMNQFGMEIPAGEGSRLPVFDGVFADIGDEQSIEQSLSTFSAHVKNISGIIQRATSRSLVLIDELGAGTDPEEGVALAMAILDHFLATGCIALTTTHHGILKNFGATRAGAQNASMGFDRESLAPTFKILLGVPGESHALEIAGRGGLPETLIEDAAAYLRDERTDISDLVANLSERHMKLTQVEEEQRVRESDLREKRRKTDLKELALRQKELELRRLGLKELRDFVARARKEWEELKARTSAGNGDSEGYSAYYNRMIKGFQERIENEEQKISRDRESLAPVADFEIREGMEVTIRNSGRRGKVLRRDKDRRWVVETETMRLSLNAGELAPWNGREAPALEVSFSGSGEIARPVLELNVIGMRVEEAIRLVEKQVDSALIHGLREFGIVHGKGEGILRRAIHGHLSGLDAVREFRFSSPEEGGYGKTIVTLKG